MNQKSTLDNIYSQVKSIILARQHPVTGLLPASTSINTHGNYTDAWVRDNVYSIMCVWALSMAYKRTGETIRSDELEQSVIKLMRHLLLSMMRQADKVEKFKHSLDKDDSLHAKYDTASGLPVVGDKEWGHLQIDATSLYLLTLAQMSAAGLRIITTLSEVDFIQNLVYYISSAYRIEDFGIWERGNKINNGKTEINASSVGMAKAALQALDNLNLFGKDATKKAVIHSIADAISLADGTLKALLPRESASKETDSALLSIIGFPAFAVRDKALVTKTRDNILAKLGGNYGCKRFLWDGHQTALEETNRLYYEHSELANFEHIESEWPLFFTYLYIHALFDGNQTTADYYREKIESLMVDCDGQDLLPELYYLPEEAIQAEKQEPGSQKRLPNENTPLVWAQSLFLLGKMLDEGLLLREHIDPLNMRGRQMNMYVNHVAVVVLAENESVNTLLHEHGVMSEVVKDIEPIHVLSAPALMSVLTHVGENPGMGLTGRNARRLQSLATSQTYSINRRDHLVLSWLQSELRDYKMADAHYLSYTVRNEIDHIRRHWMNREVAVFTWLVDAHFCQTPDAQVFFETLRNLQLKSGREHVGYAYATLGVRASRKNRLVLPDSAIPKVALIEKNPIDIAKVGLTALDPRIQSLVECMQVETSLTCFRTLEVFLEQFCNIDVFNEGQTSLTKRELFKGLYYQAEKKADWLVARACYAVLHDFPQGLADDLTMLAARHLSITIGRDRTNTYVISGPSTDKDIQLAVQKHHYSVLERALVLEVMSALGVFIRTMPSLFDGLRSIQINKLMMICADANDQDNPQDILLTLGQMSPRALMDKLRSVLDAQQKVFTAELQSAFVSDQSIAKKASIRQGRAVDTDWLAWRAMRGSITRLGDEFLQAIWQSSGQAHCLVFGDKGSDDCVMKGDFVQSSMTPGEASFANYIDQLLQHAHPPFYKSAVLEALFGFTEFCRQHPEARFESPLAFSHVLERAAKSFIWDHGAEQIGKRDLDVLLEQSPNILQHYLMQVYEDLACLVEDA